MTQLACSITALFNDLLERASDTQIALERVHRAFRPRGRDIDPCRDVICCLTDFILKEDILLKARGRVCFSHQGTEVKIF